MKRGIYTLANDRVCDQLIALLNSIGRNDDLGLEVCVIPYGDDVQRISELVAPLPNVSMFEAPSALHRWRAFCRDAWRRCPRAMALWEKKYGAGEWFRLDAHARYAAFDEDAPFDRFVYLDADTLLLDSLAPFFDALDDHDFLAYDFQRKQPRHVFRLDSPLYPDLFGQPVIERTIFCSGCFAGKKGQFDRASRERLLTLLEQGESDILYPNAPVQSLLNYMVMRLGVKAVNLTHHLPADRVTGNARTSTHFVRVGDKLFDHGKPLIYLHYIGVPNDRFARISAGEPESFNYDDLFLAYRFPADDSPGMS